MRLIKIFKKEMPEVSGTPSKFFKKAELTDSLKVKPSDSVSRCTGVLLPTTSLYSSASSAVIVAHFPGMGRLSPALIKSLQTTDHRTPKLAATHAFSIRIDSSFSNLAFSALLCTLLNRDIKGITGKFSISSSSNLSDALTLGGADVFYNYNTLLPSD